MNPLQRLWDSIISPERDLSAAQKWVLGLFNLTSVVIFWVLSLFLVSDLFELNIYRKPFLITFINTSCFIFYLVPYLRSEKISLLELISRVRYQSTGRQQVLTTVHEDYGSNENLAGMVAPEAAKTEQISEYETVKLSLQFISLWFGANLVTNASLSYTSVASQTILSTTSSFFTLIIGFLYSIERINRLKVLGIVLSFVGVTIVTKLDALTSDLVPNTPTTGLLVLWGNALALLGALIYGIYTILLKFKTMARLSGQERILDTHLFFGFVGLFCFATLWPFVIFFHFTGIETFEIPPSKHVVVLLLVNAFITFVSDFCWCRAVLLTSPLTVTVGLSMTIPLAMIGDWLVKGFNVDWLYLLGALTVTLGFLIINQDERQDFVDETT